MTEKWIVEVQVRKVKKVPEKQKRRGVLGIYKKETDALLFGHYVFQKMNQAPSRSWEQ